MLTHKKPLSLSNCWLTTESIRLKTHFSQNVNSMKLSLPTIEVVNVIEDPQFWHFHLTRKLSDDSFCSLFQKSIMHFEQKNCHGFYHTRLAICLPHHMFSWICCGTLSSPSDAIFSRVSFRPACNAKSFYTYGDRQIIWVNSDGKMWQQHATRNWTFRSAGLATRLEHHCSKPHLQPRRAI